MKYEVAIGESHAAVEITPVQGGGYRVRVGDGPVRHVDARPVGPAEWFVGIDGQRHVLGLFVNGDHFDAQLRGHAIRGTVIDSRRAALELHGAAAQGEVRTQMPGAVVRVPVVIGQKVLKGQVLVVVEAMKMENEFKSPIDGVVHSLPAQAGTAVEANTLLVVILVEGAS